MLSLIFSLGMSACNLIAPHGKGGGGAIGAGGIVPDPQFILLLSGVSLYNYTNILILFYFVRLFDIKMASN